MDDGNVIASQTVEFGATVTKPTPKKPGFIFAGWYKDANCSGTEFNFATQINESITLYAKWEEAVVIPNDGYIHLDLSPYAEQVSVCDYIHIDRKKNGSNKWERVMFYSADNGYTLDPNVYLTDYYTEPGATYSYEMYAWDYSSTPIDLGTYKAVNGRGEITINYGLATYDSEDKTLVFSTQPSYTPESLSSPEFQIRYMTDDYMCVYFVIDKMTDNKLYLKDAMNIDVALGKSIHPYEAWCQTSERKTDHCSLCWRAEPKLQGTDYYPTFTVPDSLE